MASTARTLMSVPCTSTVRCPSWAGSGLSLSLQACKSRSTQVEELCPAGRLGAGAASPRTYMWDLTVFCALDSAFAATAGCDQQCVNTPGSYHCECKKGYTLVRPLALTHPCSLVCAWPRVGLAALPQQHLFGRSPLCRCMHHPATCDLRSPAHDAPLKPSCTAHTRLPLACSMAGRAPRACGEWEPARSQPTCKRWLASSVQGGAGLLSLLSTATTAGCPLSSTAASASVPCPMQHPQRPERQPPAGLAAGPAGRGLGGPGLT